MEQLPVSFKEFAKKPVTAVLYICLIAIGYLYIDIKVSYNKLDKGRVKTITELNLKVETLYNQVNLLTEKVRSADSSIADMSATLRVLKQVGKIQ